MSTLSLDRYDPTDPAIQQDPFASYAALREQAPVWLGPAGVYFVSRHDAISEVLRQPNLFSSQWANSAGVPSFRGAEQEIREITSSGYPAVSTMLTLDPPLQTRYRKSVGKAFSTRRIESMEARIRERVCELIARWPAHGCVDFMQELAIPLPVGVIADFLSIPVEREADVKRWSDDSVAALGLGLTRERALEATRGIVEMQHCFASLIEARQRKPQDDFLSELVAAEFEDLEGRTRGLEMPEMLSIVQQLMVAGNEATTKGINEIMKLLVQNPTEWKRIQEDPATIPAMVEEGLRLASPNQGLYRICTADTEVAGVAIPKGARLWVMFGSGNRDERVFPDPDRFDPSRDNLNESLAFGRGAHFCIGAPLARLEIRVLFQELAAKLESVDFAPGTTLEYEPSFILRGLKALEIEIVRKGA